MSPASKSKGKDKSSARTTKEQQKASSKSSATGTTGSGVPASAYNPLSGTFHSLETAPTASSPPPHSNGRFRNIDETDDHSGSSLGTGTEYDSVSNNDSCSGESEDLKEKAVTVTTRQEAIPGSDNDKREKIRQKNERKHQRQRERRAQELHERCSGYLMSRKLEALSQKLVAMGFSSERAMMALILNEGRMEESVTWLFEGSEEAAQQTDPNLESGSNLKIDISEELNQITGMGIKYKCSKQEVERAVVTCEGDLEKAAEILSAQQQELSACPPKPGEIVDPPVLNGGKIAVSVVQNPLRPQVKTNGPVVIQHRRDDRDFNYTKVTSTVVTSSEPSNRNFQSEPANKISQSLRKIQAKSECVRPQVPPPAEKRWLNGGSGPCVSYSLASPLQAAAPPTKVETRYASVGSELKNPMAGSIKEPVIMMQRPQSINAKQNHPVTSISASTPTGGWYPSNAGVEVLKSTSFNHVSDSASIALNSLSSQQFCLHPNQPPFVQTPLDIQGSGWGNSYGTTGTSLSSLTIPSSLGLFSGWGTTGTSGSSSPVDWNTGESMSQCDYNSIDWTLESVIAPTRSNGLWPGMANIVSNSQRYDLQSSTTWSGVNPSMRFGNSNGVRIAGLQDGLAAKASSALTSEGTHEWTSPFGGKDLFSLPRQFVTSPSP